MVTFSNQTAIFEWCVVRCGCRTDTKLGMCLKRRAQNMSTILGSIVNMIGGPVLPSNVHENFNVDNE
jgi:hypothetical protein